MKEREERNEERRGEKGKGKMLWNKSRGGKGGGDEKEIKGK